MTIPQEQLSDEDLASKISEDGILSQDSTTSEDDGILETGIHGNASMIEGESDPALQEEPFLTDDFEEDVEQDIAVKSNDDVTEPAAVKDADTSAAPSVFTSENSTADEGGADARGAAVAAAAARAPTPRADPTSEPSPRSCSSSPSVLPVARARRRRRRRRASS